MGLNIFKWLYNAATGKREQKKINLNALCMSLTSEIYIRELAFHMISNKVANALSKCQLNVYNSGKRVKDSEWYRWNVQPNINQNATEFWHKLVDKLYDNNEALVIVNNDELYVADSFTLNDSAALFEHWFESVTVDDFTFSKRFYMGDVFYFRLNNQNLKTLLDGTMELYGKLIKASASNYLTSNGRKGVLKIDQWNEQQDDFEEKYNELVNENFKAFFEAQNAVLPLWNGYEYSDISRANASDSSDFRNMLDSVISVTANAFNVPKSIANGDVQDTSKAIDEFLTFCLDPLIELLTDEINRKLFTRNQILLGFCVKFDTKAVKHIDLLDVATAIDKLISSGCFCINDIRRVCGEDEIDEPWANQFFMTKNYSAIEDLMKSLGGG